MLLRDWMCWKINHTGIEFLSLTNMDSWCQREEIITSFKIRMVIIYFAKSKTCAVRPPWFSPYTLENTRTSWSLRTSPRGLEYPPALEILIYWFTVLNSFQRIHSGQLHDLLCRELWQTNNLRPRMFKPDKFSSSGLICPYHQSQIPCTGKFSKSECVL